MIGVLDLQGGVVEHLGHLAQLGIPAKTVKTPGELGGLQGLILPGGESTCLGRLLVLTGLGEAIREAAAGGLKLWGTCAGAILLAARVEGENSHLGLVDMTVSRNAFGSQLDSFTADAHIPGVSAHPIPLVFIRAPMISRTGPGVRILLRMEGWIAAAEDDRCLVTVFHPELSSCFAFHRYFARKCGLDPRFSAEAVAPSSTTDRASPTGRVWPRLSDVLERVRPCG